MGNLRESINLMQLVGAKLISVDNNGKPLNGIFIPVEHNDIPVFTNPTSGEITGVYLNMLGWETNASFRHACEERNAGKEGYVAPSHQLSVSYGEDFQQYAESCALKRLQNDSEFMAKNPSEEEIKKQASYAVNKKRRIGTVTPMEKKQPTPYTGHAPATTAGVWIPPAVDANGNTEIPDDLPF